MMPERKPALTFTTQIALISMIMVIWADCSGTLIVFNEIQRKLLSNVFIGPRVVSIFYFGLALSIPFVKYLFNQKRVKTIAFTGGMIYFISGLLLLLPSHILIILGLRLLQGIGAGIMFISVYSCRRFLTAPFVDRISVFAMVGFALGPGIATLSIFFFKWYFFYLCLGCIVLASITYSFFHMDDFRKKAKAPPFHVAIRFSAYLICMITSVIMIELAFNPHVSQHYILLSFLLFLISLIYLYFEERKSETAYIIPKDINALKSLDFYIIAFLTGFFLLPVLMLEIIHLTMVHGDSLIKVGFIMFISTCIIAVFCFISRFFSLISNHFKVLLFALILLEIALYLQLQIDENSLQSQLLIATMVFNASFGMIIGTGAWHRQVLGLKMSSSSYATMYVMLFSLGSLLGINTFLRTFVNRVITNTDIEISSQLTIVPQSLLDHAQTMPMIFQKYHNDIINHDANVSDIVYKLHTIYVEALVKTLHHATLSMAGIALLAIALILLKIKNNTQKQ